MADTRKKKEIDLTPFFAFRDSLRAAGLPAPGEFQVEFGPAEDIRMPDFDVEIGPAQEVTPEVDLTEVFRALMKARKSGKIR